MPHISFNWWSSRMASSASFSSSPCGWRTRLRPTLTDHLYCMDLSTAIPTFWEQWPLVLNTCDPLSVPSSQTADGFKVTVLDYLFFSFLLSSSTSVAGGQLSSPQHALVAGSFARLPPPCAPLPVSPLPCPLWYGMVGTVAGDGAPRSLSVVRSSGVCWTRPFSFYDSSLVVPRPFLLPSSHPSHALCVVFVAECCLLRYWLGFYLNWQRLAMFHYHWLTGNSL